MKTGFAVFTKLFKDCLERCLRAQAFSGREIGGDDDVLDFLVGYFGDVDLTRQPASRLELIDMVKRQSGVNFKVESARRPRIRSGSWRPPDRVPRILGWRPRLATTF